MSSVLLREEGLTEVYNWPNELANGEFRICFILVHYSTPDNDICMFKSKLSEMKLKQQNSSCAFILLRTVR